MTENGGQPLPPEPAGFHPILARWFAQTFGEPTEVQRNAWSAIRTGKHTLIAAPTGSGKTLAALLPCLDACLKGKLRANAGAGAGADAGTRARASAHPGVKVLYITPLKALNNDIHHHIVQFTAAIDQLAAESGECWPGLRAAVRTGDTTASARAAMLRRPPDVLVTTPESLFILLLSGKGRRMLGTTEYVIVDEIHDLASGKRGAHLSLSLERLTALCPQRVQRIGVSATQKPLARVARFLAGWEEAREALPAPGDARPERTSPPGGAEEAAEAEEEPHPYGYRPRPCIIVESRMERTIELAVTLPGEPFGRRTAESVWKPIIDRLMRLMEGARTVIIFVNSRRLAERLTLHLNEHAGFELSMSHHGSVSRERRLEIERRMKTGELRVIVATSSLELGIDIGHVDLVLQIDSPLEAAAGIQRFGRAGHAVGGVSRGAIVARGRGQLPEIAVLSRQIAARDIEPIVPVRDPLDVLSQHVVAMAAAAEDSLQAEALHALIVRSDSFRSFPPERLHAALQVLGGRYPFVRPLIDYDSLTGRIGKRTSSAMAALTGAGVIPQSSGYPVHHAETRIRLGELDEEYIEESRVGDVFQLGTRSWRIQSIRQDRVYAIETDNRYSEIPFWRNEGPGRSFELGRQVGKLWAELEQRLAEPDRETADSGSYAADGSEVRAAGGSAAAGAAPARLQAADAATAEWLARNFHLDGEAAAALIAFVRSQLAQGGVPTDKRLLVEYYRSVTGRWHVVLHNHWGRRVNRAWLLAIRRVLEQMVSYPVTGTARDGGIEWVLPEWEPSWLQAVRQVTPDNVEQLLKEAVAGSPQLGIAFRHIAETSLLLQRSFRRTPLWQKRIRSEELLRAALPYAESFPYLEEAMRVCLYHELDLANLREALRMLADGTIRIVVRETQHPSPLAAEFAAEYATKQLYEGDQFSGDVQLQLMQISKKLAGELFGEDAVRQAVRPEAIEAERLRLTGPGPGGPPADPEGLYALLKRRGDSTAGELAELAGGDAAEWLRGLERAGRVAMLRFGGEPRWICADERDMYREFPGTPASIAFVAGRWAEQVLSFTTETLSARYPDLTPLQVRAVIDELLLQERIEPSPLHEEGGETWMSSRIAARLIRRSVQEARKEAEPADPVRWLLQAASLQYALPGARLAGESGLLAVIARLQGLFLPLDLWESVIFPTRLTDYRSERLDALCAGGEVIWIARRESASDPGRVAFFLAESQALMEPILRQVRERPVKHPELLRRLREGGAAFLTKLARETDRLPSELLADLLDLAWDGQVSNDQFAPLRLAAAAKTAKTAKAGRGLARTGSGQGRWYALADLLPEADPAAPGTPRNELKQPGNAQTSSLQSGPHPGLPHAGAPLPIRTSSGSSLPDNRQEASVMAWTRHLLDGFGLLSKELADTWSPFRWDTLLPVLRQLEEMGIVTRGLFIRGLPSMPFVSRGLVPSLRQPLPEAADAEAVMVLAALDPANPFGLLVPWQERPGAAFARKKGHFLIIHRGEWLLWIEGGGSKVYTMRKIPETSAQDTWEPVLRTAFRAILQMTRRSKIRIGHWNGEPAADSAGAALLQALGAERDGRAMTIWLSELGR